jgi:predicted  nucleic acid-binding Zn-ribbon protein
MTTDDIEINIMKLDSKLDRVTDSIETIKDSQVDMNQKIGNIEKAIYNPDEGLYARIKEQEAEIQDLMQFKSSVTKFLWIVTSAIMGILIKFGFDLSG